ncbi:hypothetical protein KP509_24G074700 [Ceratopteris richardii]|uniref:C2 domain-containing protein n=1 Tax=Ceratopteris richardii TaxID=49495 RepID=A0A8T2RWE3_CERRI|nr:hypothetical protein KP509_24G074700 [Ceratopteris richardii]
MDEKLFTSSNMQGRCLKITVVNCNGLNHARSMLDKGILVCLDYGGFSFKTKTVKGDGYTSAFNETFSVPVRNGLNALDFEVWKEKRFAARKLIGSGCIDLHKVFTEGSDRRTCRFHARDGSKAGEIKLQMDCFGHTVCLALEYICTAFSVKRHLGRSSK